MKVRLTKHEFINWIESIRAAYDQIREIEDSGLTFDGDSEILNNIDYSIGLIEKLMYDDEKYPAVSEFCWSYDFGRSGAVEAFINVEGGEQDYISACTPEQLYDFILKMNGMEAGTGD